MFSNEKWPSLPFENIKNTAQDRKRPHETRANAAQESLGILEARQILRIATSEHLQIPLLVTVQIPRIAA